MKIEVSSEIRTACPAFAGVAISAKVVNTAYNEELWKKINEFTVRYREMYTTDSIKDMTTIHATREAYKKCGKDPSRYRPSGEALCRRILRGISLYQIDTLVDLINLVSIRFGYSIGGFDADKIVGDALVLGIGKAGEPYEGIGRGELNNCTLLPSLLTKVTSAMRSPICISIFLFRLFRCVILPSANRTHANG